MLTCWGWDKMAAIFQMTLPNAFSWMTMLEFRLRFHWSFFPRVQLSIFQHWFRWWLGAGQVTSHYLNQWWLVYWRMYALLGLNELIITIQINIQSYWLYWVCRGFWCGYFRKMNAKYSRFYSIWHSISSWLWCMIIDIPKSLLSNEAWMA